MIRMDQTMVDQKCALNQNYHEMLSQKMQQNYQFNTPMGGVRLCIVWNCNRALERQHCYTNLT